MASVVVDASAFVDLHLNKSLRQAVAQRIAGHVLYCPEHMPAEFFSAIGRIYRAGKLSEEAVNEALRKVKTVDLTRIPVVDLMKDAWALRDNYRLADGLYIALARQLGIPLVTTDRKLRDVAEVIE